MIGYILTAIIAFFAAGVVEAFIFWWVFGRKADN